MISYAYFLKDWFRVWLVRVVWHDKAGLYMGTLGSLVKKTCTKPGDELVDRTQNGTMRIRRLLVMNLECTLRGSCASEIHIRWMWTHLPTCFYRYIWSFEEGDVCSFTVNANLKRNPTTKPELEAISCITKLKFTQMYHQTIVQTFWEHFPRGLRKLPTFWLSSVSSRAWLSRQSRPGRGNTFRCSCCILCNI